MPRQASSGLSGEGEDWTFNYSQKDFMTPISYSHARSRCNRYCCSHLQPRRHIYKSEGENLMKNCVIQSNSQPDLTICSCSLVHFSQFLETTTMCVMVKVNFIKLQISLNLHVLLVRVHVQECKNFSSCIVTPTKGFNWISIDETLSDYNAALTRKVQLLPLWLDMHSYGEIFLLKSK